MFEVAEEKDYPFEITITLDMDHAEAIRDLLKHHGNSPKLARRDGKPLIFDWEWYRNFWWRANNNDN